MENQEKSANILDMLKQINQTTLTLSKNQNMLFEQYNVLNKKVDKIYSKLDKKIDNNSAKIDRNYNLICALQKDVKDLRTDIDIVYDLEKDSRKKIQHIL